jgi:homoserine O-acetyltransferase
MIDAMLHAHVRRACLAGLMIASCAAAQSNLQMGRLGDFRLESGAVIRDCQVGYRTFGKLNEQRSNAVLFPTWFTGTAQDLAALIGPGKLVDSSPYFVIAVDALGDGVSSSPSNSRAQPHMNFPEFSIRDMVAAEHDLATKVLHLSHLHAVMGISMGGMQTFQWMVSYPDFMDHAIPIVGSPRLGAYDLLLWQAELRAIEADANWKHGEYQGRPAAAMRTVADIHALALQTPQLRDRETNPGKFPEFLAATEHGEGFDTNDWYRQAQAMMGHDVSKPFGGDMQKAAGAVHARVLVVASLQDHMVTPWPALDFAKLLKARTLELNSDCGHLAVGCEEAKIGAAIARFLAD